jgi:hypothetical protein
MTCIILPIIRMLHIFIIEGFYQQSLNSHFLLRTFLLGKIDTTSSIAVREKE